tara:strand:+ start:363 stop:674 length:312 start_codon:yes stop_codon:yes gene_type:complete
MSKTEKLQRATNALNEMKQGVRVLTQFQKDKLKKFLEEEAEDIGMTSRHPNKKETKKSMGPGPISKAKGGISKGYMGGGEVHMDDSPNSGMITTKGWGKSRAT